MEGDDPPALSLTNVDLGELPVVRDLFAVHGAGALEPSGDDGGVAVDADAQVRGCVPQKLHAAGACEGERLGFGHDSHMGDGDFEVVGPEAIEGVGVACDVGLVPDLFELLELAGVCAGRGLREAAGGSRKGGDEEYRGGERGKSHDGSQECLAGG